MLARPRLARKQRDRIRIVEPDISVELLGQDRLAIVAPALGLRAVDNADEPLQPRLAPRLAPVPPRLAFAEIQQEPPDTAVMRHSLMAPRKRQTHPLHLHRLVPIV